MREYSELVDRPFKLKKHGERAKASCTRKGCTFTCRVSFGLFAIEENDDTVDAVVRRKEPVSEETCSGKVVSGWGVIRFFPHSCLTSRSESDGHVYPPKVAAYILLREAKSLSNVTQDKAVTILKPYFRRTPHRTYVYNVRKKFEQLLYGMEEKRILLLPEICRRIREAGHFCTFTTINAFKMRKLALKRAESD